MKHFKQWWWEQRAWTELVDGVISMWLACVGVMLLVGIGGLPIWLMLWLVWR
jgi:hypothetical protein